MQKCYNKPIEIFWTGVCLGEDIWTKGFEIRPRFDQESKQLERAGSRDYLLFEHLTLAASTAADNSCVMCPQGLLALIPEEHGTGYYGSCLLVVVVGGGLSLTKV